MKICGIVGWKNSGKTALVERLIQEFIVRGISVSTIKHAHHHASIDYPGTDSFRHRKAGAREVLLATSKGWALMHQSIERKTPTLAELVSRLNPVDLILVEGFKKENHPKIEAFRGINNLEPIALSDKTVLGIASDSTLQNVADKPIFPLDDIPSISDFIITKVL